MCLKLLRMGATVVATTRFPMDSGERYKKERDYGEWSHRLHIVGLDLRDISALEEFAELLKKRFPRVDILINNACQTIRRPTQYYSPLVRREAILASSAASDEGVFSMNKVLDRAICDKATTSQRRPIAEGGAEEDGGSGGPNKGRGEGGGRIVWSSLGGISRSVQLSQLPVTDEDEDVEAGGILLPSGASDVNGQQLDLRRVNSWLLKVHQVCLLILYLVADGCRIAHEIRADHELTAILNPEPLSLTTHARTLNQESILGLLKVKPINAIALPEHLILNPKSGVNLGAFGGYAHQCDCPVYPDGQGPPTDVSRRANEIHCARERDGRKILPIQDAAPPAHEHGQGCFEHADANFGRGSHEAGDFRQLGRYGVD